MSIKQILKSCNNNSITRWYSIKLQTFLSKHSELSELKRYVPSTYLKISSKIAAEHLYLICPNAAKKIADHVARSLKGNQIIAETNTGLGLISTELLERGVKQVRMYESCPEFRKDLKNFDTVYPGRVELFMKNIYHLGRFARVDKQDSMGRVESLLKNVPKKSWNDDPVMTIVGAMPDTLFLKYLMKSLALQGGPALYGRIQIFGIMKKRDYQVLTATPKQNLRLYQKTSILFQIIYDFEKLETFSRQIFLPWEKSKHNKDLEKEEMVLLKINFRKSFSLSFDQILALFYFVTQFYGSGNNLIIPILEKWVPNCGINILVPKLKHDDYFYDINLFSRFRELTPQQILSIFREMINTPTYQGSPFTDMVENELLKSETIETSLADAALEKTITKDIENLDYQDDFD